MFSYHFVLVLFQFQFFTCVQCDVQAHYFLTSQVNPQLPSTYIKMLISKAAKIMKCELKNLSGVIAGQILCAAWVSSDPFYMHGIIN